MERRVVVTGLGVVSPVGNDAEVFWKNLRDGVCGIDFITGFPTEELPVKIGGQVRDFDPYLYGMEKPFVRKQDMYSIYAMASAWQAVQDSGISALGESANIAGDRLGVYFGSGVGGFDTIVKAVTDLNGEPSGKWVSPHFIPNMIINMAAGLIATKFGACGPCLSVATACATGTHTLGEAYRAIKHGYADAIIAGGSDHCTIPIGIAGFANCKALSLAPDPRYASLPFNANRGGFVLADGAAALVLEEYDHAIARGARIYSEVAGYGSSCDAFHATAPRPDGTTQAQCMKLAAAEAGFDPASDCTYINAHGTGTPLNDKTETLAYKVAFGEYAYKCHISSTKSMHGHMLGATGAAEAIATILALRDGMVPPTINLDTPDPECDLDYTPNKAVKADLTIGFSDSFGFGGQNACIAFRKP